MAEESKNAVVKAEPKRQKPKKEKRPSRLGRKIKETWSELRKVTWPTFPVVVKSLGVVLAVSAIFLLVLMGFDLFLTYLVYSPLTTGTVSGGSSEIFSSLPASISGALSTFRGIWS